MSKEKIVELNNKWKEFLSNYQTRTGREVERILNNIEFVSIKKVQEEIEEEVNFLEGEETNVLTTTKLRLDYIGENLSYNIVEYIYDGQVVNDLGFIAMREDIYTYSSESTEFVFQINSQEAEEIENVLRDIFDVRGKLEELSF